MSRMFRKTRRYPIKYDQDGRSARERSFDLFDQGKTPQEVFQEAEISLDTAKRYYYQWRHLPPNLKDKCRFLKQILNSDSGMLQEMIKMLVEETGMTEDEVLAELQQPWGTRRIALGYWAEKARISKRDRIMRRLQAAAHIVYLFECAGIRPEKISEALTKLHQRYLNQSKRK